MSKAQAQAQAQRLVASRFSGIVGLDMKPKQLHCDLDAQILVAVAWTTLAGLTVLPGDIRRGLGLGRRGWGDQPAIRGWGLGQLRKGELPQGQVDLVRGEAFWSVLQRVLEKNEK